MGGSSPYISKLELWLRMAGIPYEEVVEPAAVLLAAAPKGLSPHVDLNGEVLDDSSVIIERLRASHNDPLNDGRLSRDQEVLGGLIKSLCEHELFFILAYGRFGTPESDFQSICRFNIGDTVPADQMDTAIEQFRTMVHGLMHTWRIGRHEPGFVEAELRKCFDMLSHSLGDQTYLFGDEPCTYDAALFGMVASIVHYPYANPHVPIAREYTNLVDYCDRIRAKYYPDRYKEFLVKSDA